MPAAFAWLLLQLAGLSVATDEMPANFGSATPLHSESAVSAELIRDPRVLDFCRVLARNAIAERNREHGAFVVRTAEGILYFVAWPPSGERRVLRWHGRFPEGTVAILHTHDAWLPAASKVDMKTARAARIPIYVITLFRISQTTGGPSEVVMEGDWLGSWR